MNTSELIKELQQSLKDDGDLEVRVATDNYNHYPLEILVPYNTRKYIVLKGWEQ